MKNENEIDGAVRGQERDRHLRTDDLKLNIGLRTARGGLVTVSSQGLKFFLSMVTTVILARLLTPQDYGLVGMVAVVTGFISIFKDLGLSTATIQRQELNEGQISTLFWINILFSVVIMLFTAAIAPLVARFYGESRLTWITIAYAGGFLLAGLTVQHEALLKRRMRFVALAITEIVSLVVGIVVAIVLAWRGANYWALVASQLTMGLCYAVGIWIACGWRPGLPVRDSGVRSMLAFGRNLTGFSIVNYFARNLDNMLIGRFWGSQQLGLYSRAYQLLMLPIDQINAPITAVAVPALSRLTDSPERYRQAYLRLVKMIALLTMPLMAFMIATSDLVVRLLLGPKWAEVSRIFGFLAVAGLVQPICNTSGWLFITQGRTRELFQWGLIASSIIIASIVLGLPWGAVGVAASYSVTFVCVVAPLLLWFVGRHGPVRMTDFYRALAPISSASVLALSAGLAFRKWGPQTSPAAGISVCLLIVYLIILLVLASTGAGRSTLGDVKALIFLLGRRNREVLLES